MSEKEIEKEPWVSYSRVSTQSQKDRKTIKLQTDRLEKYDIDHPKMEFIDHLIDDGISGTKDETGRPDYLKLKKYMEDPKIRGVVVTEMDRLGRSNYEHQKFFEESIKKNNKILILLSHNLDTSTKEGKLSFDVMCAVVEFNLRTTKETMKRGWDKEFKEHPERFGAPVKEIPEKLKKKIIHWYNIQKLGFSIICRLIQVEDIKEYPDWFRRMYIGFGKITEKEKEEDKKRFYLSPSTIGVRLREWKIKIRPPTYRHNKNR